MINESEIDPFQSLLEAIGKSESGLNVDSDIIKRIIRDLDYVKHHVEYMRFLRVFESDILLDFDLLMMALSSSVTNNALSKPGFDLVVKKLCSQYEINLSKSRLSEIDIDTIMNFIRIFLEIDYSVEFSVSFLITKLVSINNDKLRNDARGVLSNHYDVLNSIYSTDYVTQYVDSLDIAACRIFNRDPKN